MKRLATIILVIAAVFSLLSACSSSSSKDNGKDKTLVIGIDDKFAPMGFRDENNKIVGFDIDLAKAAAKKWGQKLNSNLLTGQQRNLN